MLASPAAESNIANCRSGRGAFERNAIKDKLIARGAKQEIRIGARRNSYTQLTVRNRDLFHRSGHGRDVQAGKLQRMFRLRTKALAEVVLVSVFIPRQSRMQ